MAKRQSFREITGFPMADGWIGFSNGQEKLVTVIIEPYAAECQVAQGETIFIQVLPDAGDGPIVHSTPGAVVFLSGYAIYREDGTKVFDCNG